jgi:hypothetical protein
MSGLEPERAAGNCEKLVERVCDGDGGEFGRRTKK